MKFPSKFFTLSLLLLAVLALIVLMPGKAATPSMHEVRRGDLRQTLVATGRIRTPLRVDLSSQITGRVTQVKVESGQRVSANDLLITLDPQELHAQIAVAEANVRQAELKLQQLSSLNRPLAVQTLAQAEANATQALRHRDRQRDLQARGFIGQAQLDEAERAARVAQTQLDAAQLQLQHLSPNGQEQALAESTLAQARANLTLARTRLSYSQLRAPVAGQIIARHVEVGETVSPGKLLMTLSPEGTTQVVMQIDERNLHLLSLGQSAEVSPDAYPAARLEARLTHIEPAIDPLRGALEIRLDLVSPAEFLRQDMTVSVNLNVANKQDTVLAPNHCIRQVAQEAPWVLVVRDGVAEKQTVRLGIRGQNDTEILAGLAIGERLISLTDSKIRPGDKIKSAGQFW